MTKSLFLHRVAMGAGLVLIGWLLVSAVSQFAEIRYDKTARREKTCKDARVEFFSTCERLVAQRPECEVMWAQTRGHVFDTEPANPWADEIDCSTEVK